MKLKTEVKEYENLGVESQNFSVDTNDTMIIKLLRDKMYKNKISAVCREVVSNSRDANREAGRGDTPVVVEVVKSSSNLLSEEEYHIKFKDNGIGISPNRMENIFLKYGGSTKRDSDKYTGGFGIGAKTPFAYSNEFVINTIVEENGVKTKYEYQAIITSDGKSEVSRMVSLGSEKTNEQTGTEVCVPIKSEDIDEFQYEVLYATTLWKTKPILKGFNEYKDIVKVYETNDVIIVDDKIISSEDNYGRSTDTQLFGSSTFVALIDEIPYKLDNDKMKKRGGILEKLNTSSSEKLKWVLKFETGEVSVSGSREDVEYIDENFEAFEKKVESAIKGGEIVLEKFLESPKNYIEACQYSNSINNAIGNYYYGGKIEVKGVSRDKIKFLGQIAKVLDYQQGQIYRDFNGTKRISKFSSNVLSIDTISEVNGRMKKGSDLSYREIGSKEWELPIYKMDLAKAEPTRNAMLKQTHKEGYLLITEKQIDNVHFDQNNALSGNESSQSMYERQLNESYELLNLLEIGNNIKLYSEVEKLRKEKNSDRNITDIVNVKLRYYDDDVSNYRNNDWSSLELKYDKKGCEFVDLIENVRTKTNKTNVTKIAYYVGDKLSDFSSNRNTAWGEVPLVSKSENSIRKILLSAGILVVGVSSSKLKYMTDAKINSMSEVFKNLLNDKEVGNDIKKAIEFSLCKCSKITLPLFSEIKFDTKIKNAHKHLLETYRNVNHTTKMKGYIKVLSEVSSEFVLENDIKLDSKFIKCLKTFEDFLDENYMLKFVRIVNSVSGYGSNFNKNSEDFKKAIKDYTKLFNKK
jgi:hypothetical protein